MKQIIELDWNEEGLLVSAKLIRMEDAYVESNGKEGFIRPNPSLADVEDPE